MHENTWARLRDSRITQPRTPIFPHACSCVVQSLSGPGAGNNARPRPIVPLLGSAGLPCLPFHLPCLSLPPSPLLSFPSSPSFMGQQIEITFPTSIAMFLPFGGGTSCGSGSPASGRSSTGPRRSRPHLYYGARPPPTRSPLPVPARRGRPPGEGRDGVGTRTF